MASVFWTLKARSHVLQTLEYLSDHSTTYPLDFYNRLEAAVLRLEQFPRMGAVVPEYKSIDAIRQIVVDDYRVVYRVLDDEVGIVGVVHGKQDLVAALGGHPLEIF